MVAASLAETRARSRLGMAMAATMPMPAIPTNDDDHADEDGGNASARRGRRPAWALPGAASR